MKLLRKLIDLLLYGNFWIALAAFAMTAQTQLLILTDFPNGPLPAFIFFATLFLYALHRTVGLDKVKPFQRHGRYQVIAAYRHHIYAYAGVGALGGMYTFFQLRPHTQGLLILPGLISMAYVLPLLWQRKRLRDINDIKIFLVAVVWAYVTVILPTVEAGGEVTFAVIIVGLERAFFVFAITIPFDIRDLKVDAHTQVQTLPRRLGIRRSLGLAYLSLLLFAVSTVVNYFTGMYSIPGVLALLFSGSATAMIIRKTPHITHDYFYTGLLDGLMIVQFLLVFGVLKLL